MELFFKTCGGVLIGVVLLLVSANYGKDISLCLSLCVCVLVLVAACSFLSPVMDFLREMETIAGLDSSMMKIMLKSAGIGLIGEVAGMVCTDSGHSSLGKAVQLLGTGTILWLSLPLFSAVLDLLREILGQV